MSALQWHRLGRVDDLKTKPLQQIQAGEVVLALSYCDGEFGAISGRCNHVGGPLGNGHVDADGYVVCPWHHWHFHRLTGQARPGIPAAAPRYDLKIENGDLFVNLVAATPRINAPHPAHPLTRPMTREPGLIRVVGISTSAMNRDFPRYSTSEALLKTALDHAGAAGHQTKLIRLNDLNFRACEGYYSVSRGWTAEDMEQNVAGVQASAELRDGARALADRCVAMAAGLIAAGEGPAQIERGGRKAHPSP